MVNPNGVASRGADVVVDAGLNPPGSSLTVVASSAEAAGLSGGHRVGDQVPVRAGRTVPRTWPYGIWASARRWC